MGVDHHTSIGAIAGEWDELAVRMHAPPFVRPGWIEAWWGAFGTGSIDVLALRRDGSLAGVLPLVRRAVGVHAPANWHSPSFGSVAIDDDARRQLYDAAFAQAHTYANLRFLGDDAAVAEEAARARRFTVERRVLQSSPYLDLTNDLPTPRAKALRKTTEKLGVDLEVLGSGIDAILEEAFLLEGSGWKVDEGTAIVSQPDTRRFYTEMLRWAEQAGIARVFFLRSGGRRITVELALVQDGVLYDLKGGYDPEFRKQSPGFLTQDAMIRWAKDEGLVGYDLLGDAEQWKLEWTDVTRDRFALEAFSPKPQGTVARLAYTRGRPLLKRALSRA